MIKKILSTTLTRILGAMISLLIVVINARVLGAAGVGHIGLVILDITIINLVSGYFGSAALAYFTPRTQISKLFGLSIFSSFFGPLLFWLFYILIPIDLQRIILFSESDLFYVLGISFILAFSTNLLSIILGKEKIFLHNALTMLQLVSLICFILIAFYVNKTTSVETYFNAFFISYLLVSIVALFYILSLIFKEDKSKSSHSNLFGEIFKYSAWTQSASLIQMFNYRLPYYFLQASFGNAALGVFTNSNQLAEGLWIPSKSIALVQFSKISNVKDNIYNSNLTLKLLKFSFILTFILSIIIVLIPSSFYEFVFKHKEFGEIRTILMLLMPGILCMVITMITNHYFSGIGKPKLNFTASTISFVFMVLFSVILIKPYGIVGAAIATSITYFAGAVVSMIYFVKLSHLQFNQFLLSKQDIREFRNILFHCCPIKK